MLVVDNNLSTCNHKNIARMYRDKPLPDSKVYALYNVLVCMHNVLHLYNVLITLEFSTFFFVHNDDFQILSILHRVTIDA